MSTSLRLEQLCRHGYNDKQVVNNVKHSQIKKHLLLLSELVNLAPKPTVAVYIAYTPTCDVLLSYLLRPLEAAEQEDAM